MLIIYVELAAGFLVTSADLALCVTRKMIVFGDTSLKETSRKYTEILSMFFLKT